jgi:Ca-activated chloride channel family protein
MSHRLAAALALAGILLTTVAGQQRQTFRAETRLVVLQATVKNRRGELVTNLDRPAFTVYENGRRQPIALFHRDDVPVSLGLVIDNSGSMRSLRANVEEAALVFVRRSNPLDDVFVLNFADKAHVDVPLTSDVRVLEAGIARVDSIGGTAMRDAVLMAERYLRQHASHDRRVLLVITDGNDNASSASMDQLRKTVEQSETAVFAVGLFRDDSPSAGRGREELDHLTELTGGVAYYPASIDQIDSVVLEIARQIRNEYTIAYAPVNQAFDGTYRAIQLKVAGPDGSSVRTRPGYWAIPTPVVP